MKACGIVTLVNTALDVVSSRLHVPATLPQGTQHPVPTEQGVPEQV